LNPERLKLFKDEEANSRAFSFSSPLVTLGNVLGYNPKRSIQDWIDQNNKTYPYSPDKSGKLQIKEGNKKQKGVASAKLDFSSIRHDEIQNISVIRQHLWDEASWSGILYMTLPSKPPVMALLFKNEEKARAIFEDWRNFYGEEDTKEVIRITILRGVSKENPTWYRTIISTNIDPANLQKRRIFTVSRLHTLTPTSTENLDRFTQSFKQFGVYLLAPSIIKETETHPKVLFDVGVVKRSFNDRWAWEGGWS